MSFLLAGSFGANRYRYRKINLVNRPIHRHSSEKLVFFVLKLAKETNVESSVVNTQSGEEEEEDPDQILIRRINAEVLADTGVELEQLINPSKVVNLERDIISLTSQLEAATQEDDKGNIQTKIDSKRATLAIEKRAVMRDWLKNLFVGQSVLATVISFQMVYNVLPGYEGALPLAIRVLGFWMWWLFIIPSLRARKPSKQEKDALNLAFLASPIASLALPSVTKDVALIWWANAAIVALSYLYAYFLKKPDEGKRGSEGVEDAEDVTGAAGSFWVKAFKALDYGSGQERGARRN